MLAVEAKMASGVPAIRARGEFELEIVLALHRAVFDDPYFFGDPQSTANNLIPGGTLFLAVEAGYAACLAKAGYEKGARQDFRREELLAWAEEQGITESALRTLEKECHEYGLTFPGLSDAERNRLLGLQRAYYMIAIEEWISENPEQVVPLPQP